MRKLYYVVDPMCSWCYGFAPALRVVEPKLAPDVTLELVMGGLAPDSRTPMPAEMRAYVQDAWRAVEARCGTPFNHDFWQECEPRRSTYPACRAVILAREAGLGRELLAAIQRAYYLEARNPSDESTLVTLAGEIGMDTTAFAAGLVDERTQARLLADFELRDRLGATGYPSLGVERDGRLALVTSGCLDAETLRARLEGAGLLA